MTVVKSSVMLAIASIILGIFGFFRYIVIAAFYGAYVISDAFMLAINIPVLLFGALGIAAANCFLPQYQQADEEGRDLFFSNVINLTLAAAIAVTLISALFPWVLVSLFASQLDSAAFDVTVSLLRITLWIAIPIMLAALFQMYLQAKGVFFAQRIAMLFVHVCVIFAIIAGSATGNVYLLPSGLVIGYVLYALTLAFMTLRQGFSYRLQINVYDEKIRTMSHLMRPMLFSIIAAEIHHVVDRNFASSLPAGSITLMTYASRVSIQFHAFVGASVIYVMYPRMVRLASQGEYSGLINYVRKYLQKLVPLILPFTVGLIILAEAIIFIIYERGAFTPEDTRIVAGILRMYALGIGFHSFGIFLTKILLAVQDAKILIRLHLLTLGLSVVLNFILIGPLQYFGLALSTSISAAFHTIILLWVIRKRFGSLDISSLKNEWGKMFIATAVMGIIMGFGYRWLPLIDSGQLQTLALIVVLAIVGVSVYVFVHMLLRSNFLRDCIGIVRNFTKKGIGDVK